MEFLLSVKPESIWIRNSTLPPEILFELDWQTFLLLLQKMR